MYKDFESMRREIVLIQKEVALLKNILKIINNSIDSNLTDISYALKTLTGTKVDILVNQPKKQLH